MIIPKIIPALALAALISVPSALPLSAAESTATPDAAGEKAKPCKMDKKNGKARSGGRKKKHQKRDPLKKLDLTEDQQEQAKAIRGEAKEKSKIIRDEMEKELRAILTPEQTAKLDEMKEKRATKKKAE